MQANNISLDELMILANKSEDKKSSSNSELLNVYDESGEQIGKAQRLLCHRLGLIHKVVYCFITNDKNQMLLQTRAEGRLDVAVGGHLNSDDISSVEAITREILEEIGLDADKSRLCKVSEYIRFSPLQIQKPRETNNEIRELFSYKLSQFEIDNLESYFSERQDKVNVTKIKWFDLDEIIAACDRGIVADGLQASLSHYLLWLLKS